MLDILGGRRVLTDEQRMIVSMVDRLMEKYGENYWLGLDSKNEYPDQFVREIEGAGLSGLPIAQEYGGAGLGIREASLVLEEINALGGNCQPFHGQYYLSFMLTKYASSLLKEKYLRNLAHGKIRLQTLGLTEPEAGSESTRIKCFAEKRNGSYVVTGHKIFISRVEQSDLMVLAVRTTPYERVDKKTDGISLLLVDLRNADGMKFHRIDTMINSQTYELFFDEMVVPGENLIGEEGKGFRSLLWILNPERVLLASECIGDARWFLKKSTDYAKSRVVFGKPLGANQGIQFPIAETYAKLVAADAVRWKAAELLDSGPEKEEKTLGEYANIAKFLASECSWQAANVAMDVHGGIGMAVANHVERKFRETRLYRVAPISQNLVLAYIAHSVLGLPRSY